MPTPHAPFWLGSVCHDYAGVEFLLAYGGSLFAGNVTNPPFSPGWPAEALRASARSLSHSRERGSRHHPLKLQVWCCTPRRFESGQHGQPGVQFVTILCNVDLKAASQSADSKKRRPSWVRLFFESGWPDSNRRPLGPETTTICDYCSLPLRYVASCACR